MLVAQIVADPATAAAIKTAVEGADFLQGKDAKWWFAVVLIVGAMAGLVVLKWLLASHQKYITSMETQLTEQRTANTMLNQRLIDYITTDHIKAIEALNKMSDSMDRLAKAIDDIERKARV